MRKFVLVMVKMRIVVFRRVTMRNFVLRKEESERYKLEGTDGRLGS